MTPDEMFEMWITDRSKELFAVARKARKAYSEHTPLGRMCRVYADRCEAAARALGPAAIRDEERAP